jgi:hypothetical protein
MKNFDYLLTESKTDIEEFVKCKFANLYNWALKRERQGILTLHHSSFWFPNGEVVIIYKGVTYCFITY